jgi:chemosensory pili system protein ChpC
MASTLSCLLLPLPDKNIILPSAAITEIIPYEEPHKLSDTPHWLFGILTWRGIQIPLTSLENIESHLVWNVVDPLESEKKENTVHIAILNRTYKIQEDVESPQKSTKYPFFAIVLKRIPKLYRISSEDVRILKEVGADDFRFIMEVKIYNEYAFIPNLSNLWGIIDALPSRLQWFRQIVV